MLNIPLMSNNILKSDVDSLIAFLQASDRFTNGPKVREFEEAWSRWLGVKYSVFVNSGSSANFITLSALSEKWGAERNAGIRSHRAAYRLGKRHRECHRGWLEASLH